MFITICILIWLISTILWIIWVYNEEKHWLCNVGDLIDKTEFFMWFPMVNTVLLIVFILILFFRKMLKLLKLDVLWEKIMDVLWKKIRNIKL
jgi:hypothetical protein